MASDDELISEFFSGRSTTKEDCDRYVLRNFGGRVEAVSPPGRFSYTVAAGNGTTIVQFRVSTSQLNTPYSELISNTHPGFVTPSIYIGDLGTELNIFQMEKLPGINFSKIAYEISLSRNMQMAYVESLAEVLAHSWNKAESAGVLVDRTGIAAECSNRLEELHRTLPPRYEPLVTGVREKMDNLFAKTYPLVLTHGDFSEMNILVDEGTGAVTGIVDWDEACILPFGFNLHAVEYVLGALTLEGWIYYSNASEVIQHFWTTFRQLANPSEEQWEIMQVARLAGILFRYGTYADDNKTDGMRGIRNSSDFSLTFIDTYTRV